MQRRYLFIPQISLKSLRSDSSYQFMVDLARSSEKSGRREFFYMIIPDWGREPFPDGKNLLTIPVEMNPDFWITEILGVPPYELATLFCRRGGKYVVDAMYTEMLRAAWHMGQVVADYRSTMEFPVFYADAIGVWNWAFRSWTNQIANVASYLASYPMVTTPEDIAEYTTNARDWFKPSVVDTATKRFVHVPNEIDLDFYERVAEEERPNKHPKISLFCGMRFNENKNVKFILDVFRTLYASGRDIHVVSTTGTDPVKGAQHLPDKDRSYFTTMKFGCPRDEYARQAARCHVFLSGSKYETFITHIAEQLAMGLVGVVPDHEWVWRWLPKDYPFAYELGNRDQAYTMVSWVMDHYEKALEMCRPYQDYVREKYGHKNGPSNGVLDEFGKVVDRQVIRHDLKPVKFLRKGKFRLPFRFELCEVADSLGQSFTMDQLVTGMKAKMAGMDPKVMYTLGGPRLGVPTLYDIRQILECYGWEDACDGPEVRFERTARATVPSEKYADLIAKIRSAKDKKAAVKELQAAEAAQEEEDDFDAESGSEAG